MRDVEKIYRNTEEFAEWNDKSLKDAIAQNYVDGRLDLVAQNVDNAAKSAITLAMARMRFSGDFTSVVEALNNGVSFSRHLFKVEATLHKQTERGESLSDEKLIQTHSLWWPLLCHLLAGNWSETKKLAQLLKSPVVIEGNVGGIFHHLVELLTSLIGDEKDDFFANRLLKKPPKEKPPVFTPFVLLAQAVMQRDQASFNSQMEALHDDFSRRAKTRADGLEEYGYGQKNNALCLDFQSIAVCKIASKRDMKIAVESEYIPLVLVNYWQS